MTLHRRNTLKSTMCRACCGVDNGPALPDTWAMLQVRMPLAFRLLKSVLVDALRTHSIMICIMLVGVLASLRTCFGVTGTCAVCDDDAAGGVVASQYCDVVTLSTCIAVTHGRPPTRFVMCGTNAVCAMPRDAIHASIRQMLSVIERCRKIPVMIRIATATASYR